MAHPPRHTHIPMEFLIRALASRRDIRYLMKTLRHFPIPFTAPSSHRSATLMLQTEVIRFRSFRRVSFNLPTACPHPPSLGRSEHQGSCSLEGSLIMKPFSIAIGAVVLLSAPSRMATLFPVSTMERWTDLSHLGFARNLAI